MCYGCRGSESVVWGGEVFQGIGGSVISGLCKVCKGGGGVKYGRSGWVIFLLG